MTASALINLSGFSAYVYDPQRDLLHITTADGSLYDWSVGQGGFTGSLRIGGTPDTVDITADGRFLLIGNHDRVTTSAPGAAQPTFAAQVTRVDVATHAVDHFQYDVSGLELGISQIAVAADNTALVRTVLNGSGFTSFRAFQAEDAQPTFQPVSGQSQILNDAFLVTSENRGHILIEEGLSSAPLHIYNATNHTVDTFGSGQGSFPYSQPAIDDARGLVVVLADHETFVLDNRLHRVVNLSSYTAASAAHGAAFSPGGEQLFLWQDSTHRILVLDTQSWQPMGQLDAGIEATPGQNHNVFGQLDVISAGKVLVLNNGATLQLVDLTETLKLTFQAGAGDDQVNGSVGQDSLAGGAGADTVNGGDGQNYLRGDDGNDIIHGGAAFDDINGNMGDDTATGGPGDDWVVGGKDNDNLSGDEGADIVWGNLGNDWLDGGLGNDQVRGGQGNDVIFGQAGDDWLSGDRGDDTLTGGAGADIFHGSQDAGIDRVLDFSQAEGDRVLFDPGTTYTVSQVGADTVIDMGGGHQMILVGVQLSTLAAGWILGA